MKRLRVGVVGVGHLGQHHARILAAMPDVELVAVADSRPEQAQTVADRCGTRAVSDYHELLGRVDAVSIAVPTVLHREVAGTFLSRGIPALVEKPLASSLAEAELLVSLAIRPAPSSRSATSSGSTPRSRRLQQMAIRPKYMSAERLSTYTFRSTDIGVVLDLMIHDIDLVLSLTVSPGAVGGRRGRQPLRRPRGRRQRPDRVRGRHRGQPHGQPGQLHRRAEDADLGHGGLRVARFRRPAGHPGPALGGVPPRPARTSRAWTSASPRPSRSTSSARSSAWTRSRPTGREPLALELEDFVQALRGGARPRVSGDDALRAMRRGRPGPQEPRRPPLGRRATAGLDSRPVRGHPLGAPRPPRLADQEPPPEPQADGALTLNQGRFVFPCTGGPSLLPPGEGAARGWIIDFTREIGDPEDPRGARVKITMSGNSLPCKRR